MYILLLNIIKFTNTNVFSSFEGPTLFTIGIPCSAVNTSPLTSINLHLYHMHVYIVYCKHSVEKYSWQLFHVLQVLILLFSAHKAYHNLLLSILRSTLNVNESRMKRFKTVNAPRKIFVTQWCLSMVIFEEQNYTKRPKNNSYMKISV